MNRGEGAYIGLSICIDSRVMLQGSIYIFTVYTY
jgi:hypothetical protein